MSALQRSRLTGYYPGFLITFATHGCTHSMFSPVLHQSQADRHLRNQLHGGEGHSGRDGDLPRRLLGTRREIGSALWSQRFFCQTRQFSKYMPGHEKKFPGPRHPGHFGPRSASAWSIPITKASHPYFETERNYYIFRLFWFSITRNRDTCNRFLIT